MDMEERKASDKVVFLSGTAPEKITFYSAYTYPRNPKTTRDSRNREIVLSDEEKDFFRELMSFKDTKPPFNGPSEKIRSAIVNRVKKAILDIGSIENTIVVNMPSSRGAEATERRWSAVNDELKADANRIHVLESGRVFYSRPREEAHAVNSNGNRDMDYEVLKDLVLNCEDEVAGRNVILLDDVVTTGKHFAQIGQRLKDMGARSVTAVALCCTAPRPGHDDSRYRYNLVHDDYCRRHAAKFSQVLDPFEDQRRYHELYYRENPQLSLLDRPMPLEDNRKREATVLELKTAEPMSMAAEKETEYTNNTYSMTDNIETKGAAQAESAQTRKNSLPQEFKVAYANLSPIIGKEGNEVKVVEPRFATTLSLSTISKMTPRIVVGSDQKEHKMLDLAIVPNKQYIEGKTSPYLIIAKRHGAEAHYNGKDLKFVDKDSVLEFTINRNQLIAKSSQLGRTLQDNVQLHIGRSGAGSTCVTLNPAEFPGTDRKSLELSGSVTVVNSFERRIKAMQAMERIGENKFSDKYLGTAFGCEIKDADGKTLLNQFSGEPVMAYNIKLNATDIKYLPEADKFGNISLAVVRRDLSAEALAEKGLHMEEGSVYPVNERGFKQPNYHIVADPKIYKNGEPSVNIVAVVKLNKSELAGLPVTSEQFTTKEGREVRNSFIHLSSDRFGQIKPNLKAYEFNNIPCNDMKISARFTAYSPAITQKERQSWEARNPRLSAEDFAAKVEREKSLPNQYDIYREAVAAMQPKQKQEKTVEAAVDAKAEQAPEFIVPDSAPKREYKDYSITEEEQKAQSKAHKLPF